MTSGLDYVEVGQRYAFAKTVGETDVTLFAGITGDFSDTHINDQYMKEKSNIGRRIAHAGSVYAYVSQVFGVRSGFVVGWLLLLTYVAFTAGATALAGGFVAVGLARAGIGTLAPWLPISVPLTCA